MVTRAFLKLESLLEMVEKWLTIGQSMIIILWLSWLFIGSAFYAVIGELGWCRGFYMAVNVGYSIGWGYPAERRVWMDWFSIGFLLIGASAVALLLISFAESITSQKKEWFISTLNEAKWEQRRHRAVRYWIHANKAHLAAILYWMCWIGLMSLWSCLAVQWSMVQGLYFAISSCSTGGLLPIPESSPDYFFVIVGIFTAIGVPLMGYAMGHGAMLLKVFASMRSDAESVLDREASVEELATLLSLGLERRPGSVSKLEFMLLCSLRLGALDASLVSLFNRKFEELGGSDHGGVQYEVMMTPKKELSGAALPSLCFRDSELGAGSRTNVLEMVSEAVALLTPIKAGVSRQQSTGDDYGLLYTVEDP